jgi:hypothetical protein
MRQSHGRDHVQLVHLYLGGEVSPEEDAGSAESSVVDDHFQVGRGGDTLFDGVQIPVLDEIGSQNLSAAKFLRKRIQSIAAPGDED